MYLGVGIALIVGSAKVFIFGFELFKPFTVVRNFDSILYAPFLLFEEF